LSVFSSNAINVPNAFYYSDCGFKLQPKDLEDRYVDKIKKLEAEMHQVNLAEIKRQQIKDTNEIMATMNQDRMLHKRKVRIIWATAISITIIGISALFLFLLPLLTTPFGQENNNIAELEQKINEKQTIIDSLERENVRLEGANRGLRSATNANQQTTPVVPANNQSEINRLNRENEDLREQIRQRDNTIREQDRRINILIEENQ
jgi:cell division protein FtsL